MIHALLALLAALQIADLWTTRQFLKLGGREANPIGRWLFDKTGWIGPIALKLAVTLGTAAYVLHWPQFWFVLIPCIFLMVWVVVGNLDLIATLKARRGR